MKITITIPDSAVPAVLARVAQFNKDSGQPPITLEEWRQRQSDDQTAREVEQYNALMLDLMRSVGIEIAAAAGGDPAKIAAALEAGKAAALQTLS